MIQGIIESLLLVKDSHPPVFIDLNLKTDYPDDQLARIPVHIDYVSDYNTDHSHLSKEGILQFVKWRPEFAGSMFKNTESTCLLNELTDDFKIHTLSETGKCQSDTTMW